MTSFKLSIIFLIPLTAFAVVSAEQWYILQPGDGSRCGPFNNFTKCNDNFCCSQKGFCGQTDAHCKWTGLYMNPDSQVCQDRGCAAGDICTAQGYCAYCQDGCQDADGNDFDMGPSSKLPAPNAFSNASAATNGSQPTLDGAQNSTLGPEGVNDPSSPVENPSSGGCIFLLPTFATWISLSFVV